MATKRLARTVIEGGRTHWSTWHRRHSHRAHRARERAQRQRAGSDADAHDDLVWTEREHVHKSFFDKLGPCRRWLASHIGEPWNDVHSRIMATFDTRTLAGRHIVFDHLLEEVAVHACDERRWHRFFVDDRGLLQKYDRPRHRRTWTPTRIPDDVARWLAGRRVGRRGEHLFWFVAIRAPRPNGDLGPFRQHRRLTAGEARFFAALSVAMQQLMLYLDER